MTRLATALALWLYAGIGWALAVLGFLRRGGNFPVIRAAGRSQCRRSGFAERQIPLSAYHMLTKAKRRRYPSLEIAYIYLILLVPQR